MRVDLQRLEVPGSRQSTFDRLLPFVWCGLAAALAAAPLFSNPGFLSTRGIGDSPNLLFRVHQLLAAWSGGEFPARWMPDAAYGYGMPYFTYYASASTHLAALFRLYGFSFVEALKLAQGAALLAAAGGMYGWARAQGLGRAAAALAAAAYTFAPFHLVNLYVRGDSLAELWAMGLYPLTLWAAQRCLVGASLGQALALAAAVAALICTHNISALNFLPFVLLYLVVGGGRRAAEPRRMADPPAHRLWPWPWVVVLAAVAWGLSLSAFFWLPALVESGAVNLGDLTQGYFFYGNHFRGADLVQTSLIFDYARQPFSLGLIQALLAGAGTLAAAWRAIRARRWSWLDPYSLFGLAAATFMITPLSQPLWDGLPLLRYTQFPWRFLSIQALFTAVLTARLLDNEPARVDGNRPFARAGLWPSIVALALTGVLALTTLAGLRLTFIPLDDADVTAARLNLYEYFTTAIGNTVNAEYLPRAVVPRPYTSDGMLGRAPRLKALTGAAVGERLWKRGASEQWRIEVMGETTATIAVPTHDWLGWRGEADGRPLSVRAAEGLGWIAFDLPPGTHTVTLWLGRTPLRAAAEAFSLLALLGPAGVWFYRQARGSVLKPQGPDGLGARSVLWLVGFGALALGSGILHLIPSPPASPLPLNMDFDTLAYPHHDVVRFEDGAQLTRVDYDADHLQRGDTLAVQTEWRLTHALTAYFQLALPQSIAARPSTAAAVQLMPDSEGRARSEFALAIPKDLTPGLYFLTVELSDKARLYSAVTAEGTPRGRVYLAPVWIDGAQTITSSAQPALAELGPVIRVVTATAGLEAGDTLNALVHWQALADAPRNYQFALRVRDSAGNEWGSGDDTQAGSGYYPTSLWRPGEVIPDSYRVTLTGPGEPPGEYELSVVMYDVGTRQPLGEARIPFALNRRHPRGNRAAQFTLAPDLGLERVVIPDQVKQGDVLSLAADWLTGPRPLPRYRARWSLRNDGNPALPVYTTTLDLAPNSPTDRWPLEAFLLGRAQLPLPNDFPPGSYTLTVQLVDEADRAVGAEAHVGAVDVAERAREFNVPPVETELGATFDGQLKLWGYDSEQTSQALQLTLVWGALETPRGDYKYFVHVFDPADGAIAAQVDAVPRDFTYPTSLWAKGEVVTETVTVSLTDAPPGDYSVAVGWYDPRTPDLDRLPAFDAQGQPLVDGRVILPLGLEVGN